MLCSAARSVDRCLFIFLKVVIAILSLISFGIVAFGTNYQE